jgi:hypothetical protein
MRGFKEQGSIFWIGFETPTRLIVGTTLFFREGCLLRILRLYARESKIFARHSAAGIVAACPILLEELEIHKVYCRAQV